MMRDIWGLRAARPSRSHPLRDICGGVPAYTSEGSGEAPTRKTWRGGLCAIRTSTPSCVSWLGLPSPLVRHKNCRLNPLFTLARCHVVAEMLRDTESKTSIEGHKVDEVNDTALTRCQYIQNICLLFCYLCHVAFFNFVSARARQLPRDEDSEKFISVLGRYSSCSCTLFGLAILIMMLAVGPHNGWGLTVRVLYCCLIFFDSILQGFSGWLLNFFPSVKFWSLGDIAEYTTWEAYATCLALVWVSVRGTFKLASKRVSHKEKEAASYCEGSARVSDTDAKLRFKSFERKLNKVFHFVFLFNLLLHVFFVIKSYPDLVKSESFGKFTLYGCALMGTSFFQLVGLVCAMLCCSYILISEKEISPLYYCVGCISWITYLFLGCCQTFILSTVSLVG
ncbi:FACR295Cp [Eremothecium gossypii FDAG1]|nr:FACR295Cp [Eremothecium gossypii FDAG1]